MSNKIQINFTNNQIKKLHEEKQELGSSINSIVRRAVNDYFLKNKGGNIND